MEDSIPESSSTRLSRVYDVARSLRPAALAFTRHFKLDPSLADDCLMESAQTVVKKVESAERFQKVGQLTDDSGQIGNLPAYIFTTFKNLVLAKLRDAERLQHLSESEWGSMASVRDVRRDIERTVLVGQIIKLFDPESRFIYDHLVLGYTYQEMADEFNAKFGKNLRVNALRSRFSKAIRRIINKVETQRK